MELSFANVEYSNVPDNKNKIVSAEIVATNVSVSLANSIRRVLLSNLPNVGFNEKLINIKENTSAAHNELIKHRISLLPIYRDSRFKILSYMDNTTNKRVFTFAEDSIIPIFTLNKQNQNNFLAQQINIEDVMSNEFEVFISKTLKEEEGTDKEAVEGPDEKQQEREMLDIEDFFESDYFTNRVTNGDKINGAIPGWDSCVITNDKDTLDNSRIADRINNELLDPFRKNEYTHSLESFAY